MGDVDEVRVRSLEQVDVESITGLGARRVAAGDLWEPPEPGSPGVVLLVGDEVVAAGWVEWWDESDGTHLYLLLGYVDPERRGTGIGHRLLDALESWASRHAAARGVEVTFGANADGSRPRAQQLLDEAGYVVAFTVVEMRREVPAVAPTATPPQGFALVPMEEGRHAEVHALVEAAFGTSRLGAVPRDFDDYLQEVAAAPSGIDLWRLLEHEGRLVGAVVNVVDGEVGDTPWVAVDPGHRGRGLGECLMRSSLGAFAGAGARTAVLTTIAENPYRSVGLYERVGYRVTTWLPRYRKRG